MSGPPRQLPPPSSRFLLPTLGAVTYVAALVAFWGFLSLGLDRDVVDYPDASPLLGPAMAAAGCLVTWVALVRSRGSRHPGVEVVASGILSLAAMLLVSAIGYAPAAALHFALSPFVLGAAALSALTVLVTRLVGSSAVSGII